MSANAELCVNSEFVAQSKHLKRSDFYLILFLLSKDTVENH